MKHRKNVLALCAFGGALLLAASCGVQSGTIQIRKGSFAQASAWLTEQGDQGKSFAFFDLLKAFPENFGYKYASYFFYGPFKKNSETVSLREIESIRSELTWDEYSPSQSIASNQDEVRFTFDVTFKKVAAKAPFSKETAWYLDEKNTNSTALDLRESKDGPSLLFLYHLNVSEINSHTHRSEDDEALQERYQTAIDQCKAYIRAGFLETYGET